MKFFYFILFTFFTFDLFADAHHKGLLSSVNIGARYSSALQKRGAVFYSDFQIDPVLALFFLDDRIEFLGDSLSYRDDLKDDIIRYRFQLASISDNPLFPAHDSIKNQFVDRDDTQEVSAGLEFFLPGYNSNYQAEIDITYAKDIVAHKGNYLELTTKYKLTDFNLFNTHMEPNFIFKFGWGDEKHNAYFYGPSDHSAGLNHFAYGFWLAFPEEADRYFPILQIMKITLLGDERRHADYVKDQQDQYFLSFIATVGLLE